MVYQGEAPRGAWVLNPNDNSYHAPPAPSSTTVVPAPTPDTIEVPVADVSNDNNSGNAIVEDAGDVWNRLIAEEEAANARAAAAAAAAAVSAADSTPPATIDKDTENKHPADASTSVNSSASASLPPQPSTNSPTRVPSSPSATRSQDSPGVTVAGKPQPPSEGTSPVTDGLTATETLAALDEKLRVLSTTQAPVQPPATAQSDPKESTQKTDAGAFVR